MASAVATTGLTFEEYTQLPPIEGRYDIIDGELIIAPSPFPLHQWYQENIVRHLDRFVRKRRLGVVLPAPCDVVIRVRPLRTRQPDALYVSYVFNTCAKCIIDFIRNKNFGTIFWAFWVSNRYFR